MEYKKAYVFEPREEERSRKRRRIEEHGLQASWPLRRKACQAAWQACQSDIDTRLDSINATTIGEITQFLENAATQSADGRTSSGFILAGPDSTLYNTLTTQLTASETKTIRRLYVPIASTAGTNLKGLLKAIIRKATSRSYEEDDDDLEGPSTARQAPRLLNYDLQILYDYVQERQLQQVVIAIEDTEAFDSHLLSELVEILNCWQDRLRIVLLFNIATSVDFLQQRLPQAAIRCLNGRLFDSALLADEVEQVVAAITRPDTELWIGSSLASMLLERQRDYTQSIDSLVDGIRYAYMCSYYANALSLFSTVLAFDEVPEDHFEALRNLPSFQVCAERLLENGETETLQELLESDQAVFDLAQEALTDGRRAIAEAVQATEVIQCIQGVLTESSSSPRANLYIQVMAGKLNGSPLLRSLYLSLRKTPSNTIMNLLERLVELKIPQDMSDTLVDIATGLNELIEAQTDAQQPLRSEYDVKNSTLRTTVVAQKVELSKQKSTLSKQDAAYTVLLRQITNVIESYFARVLITPKDLLLHEIFVYDLRSPHREVLMPRPRHAVERALAAPHDYLDCDCCAPADREIVGINEASEGTLAATQPATALLYQLYLESGNLINVHDLWQAYRAVVGEGQEEDLTAALFQRGLAELRYLGVVKSTRRRVDHIAKVSWRGL